MCEYRLFGDCHRFVADKAEDYPHYTIECVIIPKLRVLVHAYFRDSEGNYFDSRNVLFSDKESFFAEFNMTSAKWRLSETHSFQTVKEFKQFIFDFYGGETISEYVEDTDTFYRVPIF